MTKPIARAARQVQAPLIEKLEHYGIDPRAESTGASSGTRRAGATGSLIRFTQESMNDHSHRLRSPPSGLLPLVPRAVHLAVRLSRHPTRQTDDMRCADLRTLCPHDYEEHPLLSAALPTFRNHPTGGLRMSEPLTMTRLNQMQCQVPGCNHKDHTALYLKARCHMTAGVTVRYDREPGTLTIRCEACESLVATVQVAVA